MLSITASHVKSYLPQDKGRPLPKFGEWDVNDPASAEGFTVIFNKARNEKKAGGKPDSPTKDDPTYKHEAVLGKPQSVSCCYFLTLFPTVSPRIPLTNAFNNYKMGELIFVDHIKVLLKQKKSP